MRALTTDPENRVPHLAFQPGELTDLPLLPIDQVETAYYLRLKVVDEPGVMARIAGILGDAGISIEAIQQKEPTVGGGEISLILLTRRVLEGHMMHAIAQIEGLGSVIGKVVYIRVEHLAG